MGYEVGSKTKGTDVHGSFAANRSKQSGAVGGMMQLQRTMGNRNVGQLLGSGSGYSGIQRKAISEEGYSNVFVTNYFKNTHLASSEEKAKTASLSREDQYGRGLHNTVIEGGMDDIKDKVKAADYDDDTYAIGGNQYGVGIDVDYWQVGMRAGSSGNVISSIEKTSGTVYVKAYFNEGGKMSVTGIDG